MYTVVEFSTTGGDTTRGERLRAGLFTMFAVEDRATRESCNDIETLHREACTAGRDTYIDPATGYQVFTEHAHRKRGKCCGSGCRHCPFGYASVPAARKAVLAAPILAPGLSTKDHPHAATSNSTAANDAGARDSPHEAPSIISSATSLVAASATPALLRSAPALLLLAGVLL